MHGIAKVLYMRSRMIAICFGITSVCWFPWLPERYVLYGFCLPVLVLACHRQFRCHYLLLFFFGICWGVEYGYRVLERQLPVSLEGQVFEVEGEVIALPHFNQQYQRFRLQVKKIACVEAGACPLGVRQLQLNWYQNDQQLVPGQYWQLRVKLQRPYGTANPGGFDYQGWMIQQGIGATGYVKDSPRNRLLGQNRWSVSYWRWRLQCHLQLLLGELDNGGILVALLLGDKQGITDSQWQLFAQTNTTHLMVISGLHIGLVAALAALLGRWLSLLMAGHIAADRLSAVMGVLAALFYSFAAGFSLPTQRALVMVAVMMGAFLLRRQVPVAHGLLLALLVCLLWDPLAPCGPSFWLSFTAVAAIAYGLSGRLGVAGWKQGLYVQWLVWIGLLPVLVLFFGQISWLSPLANTVLVPLFSLLVVPLNFMAMPVSLLSPSLASLLFAGLDWLLGLQFDYLQWLVQLPLPVLWHVPAIAALDMALALAGVFIVLLPRAVPLRACGLLLMVPLLMTRPAQLERADMVVTVLDVGQGLSVLVQTATHNLVYDIGPSFGDSFSSGLSVLAPYLNYRGVESIDKLVISHSDNDHSGNWPQFVESLQVQQLVYGEQLAAHVDPLLVPVSACLAGQQWQWDGVEFMFLHPTANSGARLSANNMSCVLKVTAGTTSLLITGDIERAVERQLASTVPQELAVDILLAPHHGSKTSSSWPFIRQVNASHVVFTTGYRNRFRHPHPQIVRRYRQLGAQIYNSAEDGAIIFSVQAGQLEMPQRYRSQLKRYWL